MRTIANADPVPSSSLHSSSYHAEREEHQAPTAQGLLCAYRRLIVHCRMTCGRDDARKKSLMIRVQTKMKAKRMRQRTRTESEKGNVRATTQEVGEGSPVCPGWAAPASGLHQPCREGEEMAEAEEVEWMAEVEDSQPPPPPAVVPAGLSSGHSAQPARELLVARGGVLKNLASPSSFDGKL